MGLRKTFENKLVFITGGSEGIGKALAAELISLGANVTIFSRNQNKLDTALSELKTLQVREKQKIGAHSLDVTDDYQVHQRFESLVSQSGPPNYVFNCAGFAMPGYIQNLDLSYFKKMMGVNYFGTVNVCKSLVPYLIEAKSGHIINTSSMAGFIGLFGYTGYCASKYAVNGFSEALGRELKPYGIRVSVLCPPNTNTPGLKKENEHKPPEILAVEEKAQPVNADIVAKATLKAVTQKKTIILPTTDGVLAHLLSRYAPGILNQFVKR